MEFMVKLIRVIDTADGAARDDLQANCTHVVNDLWLFEGDGLDEGVSFKIIDEVAIEAHGDLSGHALIAMVREKYGVKIRAPKEK